MNGQVKRSSPIEPPPLSQRSRRGRWDRCADGGDRSRHPAM